MGGGGALVPRRGLGPEKVLRGDVQGHEVRASDGLHSGHRPCRQTSALGRVCRFVPAHSRVTPQCLGPSSLTPDCHVASAPCVFLS